MQFICDFSDRLEIEGAVSKLGLKVEVAAADIISTNFTNKMEPKVRRSEEQSDELGLR